MIIVFSGVIGRLPVGAHAWIAMQYLAGLRALGHDVYFLEDCGHESWVYDWDAQEVTRELAYPADYIRSCLAPLGLAERWIYRAGESSAGMPVQRFTDVCAADLLIMWAVPVAPWRSEYDLPRRRAYVDADPGFTQISLAQGREDLVSTLNRCEQVFTIAQRVGHRDCVFPDGGRRWHKTVSPVALEHWTFPSDVDAAATHFTSVMQWQGFREATYEGVTYGQKDKEFSKFIDLPSLTSQPIRLASLPARRQSVSRRTGWDVVEGWIPSRTPASFRQFVRESRAEFGVAKQGYVLMRGGWFSDRSACYLASGRPALLQDTGQGDWLPTGAGVLTFTDVAGAAEGIERINADYDRHSLAARRLAEEHFATERVLPPLIEAATQ